MRGQALVGGMQMCVLGTWYSDAGLIKVAGIDVVLWRIHVYASDALVLKLCSYTTVHKIMECLYVQPNRDTTEMNQATLIYALLFNRAFLYAIKGKGPLSARGRIWMIWSATVFFLHIKGVTTDEVCEHLFGTWRGHSDGFTA
eukprot:scaffold106874_cov62-Attheya_sp.AAC.2